MFIARMTIRLSFAWVCALAGLAIGTSIYSARAADPDRVSFSRDVLPLFSEYCFQCHGPDASARKGKLRLDVESDVKRDRDGHRVVVPGQPDSSEMWRRLTTEDLDERMPPAELGRALEPSQIATLKRWIEQGAEWGRHWSFTRVERPSVPDPARHPVDAFVHRRLESESIAPVPMASRKTLIRRLSLDLTGLPPTPKELEAFLADDEPGAWERLVDRALASPAYGQRMAWDWLDAARYADSNGYQGDRERTMWPWRDWVVRAFNENLPWDQFTIWQLAGDLLPDPTPDQLLATGFNRNHMINGEGGRIPEENRVDYVMDMTETMGTVWLGLTLNCSKCHDHKFDPVTQRDYYSLSAFFNQTPVDGSGGHPQTPPVLELPNPKQTDALAEANAAWSTALADLQDDEASRFPRADDKPPSDSEAAADLPKPVLEALKTAPASRRDEHWDSLAKHFSEAAPEYAAKLRAAREAKSQRERASNAIPKVMIMADREKSRSTFLLDRGLYNQPREEVPLAVPASLPPLGSGEPANRLGLARWLVSRDHPLTARVTVNRFWQMLFGIGLVKTVEDFGVQSEYPAHPELLDWLAAEFMESGWDVKHLLRVIVTSETYRRSSDLGSPDLYESDPDNRLLARGPRFRMPSWMIRDQALAAAGLLQARSGGESVNVYQPPGIWEEATFGNKTYRQDHGSALYRRSLYIFWRRIVGPAMFFDTAKRQVCEVKTPRTNTPMHALATLNDITYVEAARALAERVLKSADEDLSRLQLASRLVLCREPSAEEWPIWQRTLHRSRAAFETDRDEAVRFLAHGESPRDESLPLAEHAAWTALCLNLLNLDETLTKP